MAEKLTLEKQVKLGEIPTDDLEVLANSNFDTPIVVNYAVTADATGGLEIISSLPCDMEILDVIVQCTTANTSGTLLISESANAITNAMICAVDKVIVRAGTIDDAFSKMSAGDTLKVTANGNADRGTVTIIAKRS